MRLKGVVRKRCQVLGRGRVENLGHCTALSWPYRKGSEKFTDVIYEQNSNLKLEGIEIFMILYGSVLGKILQFC